MLSTHYSQLASRASRLTASLPRFLLGLIAALALCFGLQAIAYFGFDCGTGKSESNYFSTMSRFQAAATPAAKIAFVGSSITGRLPGRESGNQNIANLGSDGGPALDGMRLIASGQIEAPQWIVIEANTLYGGVGYGDTLIVKGAQGPWFDIGARAPLMGASARPSAMLYAKLLRRPKVLTGEAFAVTMDPIDPCLGNPLGDFTEGELKRFADYIMTIEELQQGGANILAVTYPAGVMTEREVFLMRTTLAEFAKRFSLNYIDLSKQIPRENLEFTDSVHLGPVSAARILKTIVVVCEVKSEHQSK